MKENAVIIVGGGKGGVGKSTISLGIIDLLSSFGRKIFIMECDDTISDVGKAYQNSEIESVLRPIKNEEDVLKFGRLVERHSDSCIVVNTAGGGEMEEFGGCIADMCKQLGRELLILWPINRSIDTLNVARRCHETCGDMPFVIVLNKKYGEPYEFELFNENTKFKASVKTVEFPVLAQSVMDKIINNRLNLTNAQNTLDKANEPVFYAIEKSMISQFRSRIAESLSGLFVLE